MWTFREDLRTGDIVGYDVEALDGSIGEIDDATDELGASFIVVKTGPWIFRRPVVLPATVVERIDHDVERVYVSRTKEQIKNAPEYDEALVDDDYRVELGRYYGPGGAGFREPS
jgi:hypothetical protein